MRDYFVLQGYLAVSEAFLYVTAEGRFLHPVGSDAVNHPTLYNSGSHNIHPQISVVQRLRNLEFGVQWLRFLFCCLAGGKD